MVTVLSNMDKLKQQIDSLKEENKRLQSMIQVLQKQIHQSRNTSSQQYHDLYL